MENKCEICEKGAPPGHRFCDLCWPEEAINGGKAARCAVCGRPGVIEKMAKEAEGEALICLSHSG